MLSLRAASGAASQRSTPDITAQQRDASGESATGTRMRGDWRRESGDRLEQFLAGLLAAAALLGARAAVLHAVLGVLLALVAAAAARGDARLQHRAGQVGVVLGLPADDALGRRADVSAVEIQADALGQLSRVKRSACFGALALWC